MLPTLWGFPTASYLGALFGARWVKMATVSGWDRLGHASLKKACTSSPRQVRHLLYRDIQMTKYKVYWF